MITRKIIICLYLSLCLPQASRPPTTALSQYQQAMNYLLERNGSEKSPQKAQGTAGTFIQYASAAG